MTRKITNTILLTTILIGVIFISLNTQTAFAQPILYGLDSFGRSSSVTSSLYTIDTTTGAATLVGSTGFIRCSGMDFDSSGTLFATCERTNTDSVLVKIDTSTGLATEVGPTGAEVFLRTNNISDISFRNSDGVLFGYGATNGPLMTINTATGAATPIGTTQSTDAATSIAFSLSDVLFHTRGFSAILDLETINPTNGLRRLRR